MQRAPRRGDKSRDSRGLSKPGGPRAEVEKAITGLPGVPYEQLLADFCEAVQSGDKTRVSTLLEALTVPDPAHEALLWEYLMSPEADHRAQLYIGSLLGRIGGEATLEKCLDVAATVSASENLSYTGSGSPSRSMALANAVIQNALRGCLTRLDGSENAATFIADLAANENTVPFAKQMLWAALLAQQNPGKALQAMFDVFENSEDAESRSAILGALATSCPQEAGPRLVAWYERFPAHQRSIALALAKALPPSVSITALSQRARSDLVASEESPALEAITYIGTTPHSYDVLAAAYATEPSPLLRRAMLRALVLTKDVRARQLVLEEALHGEHPEVRAIAVAELPRLLGPDQAAAAVVRIQLTTRDPTVSTGIRAALIQLSVTVSSAESIWPLIREEIVSLPREDCLRYLASLQAMAERESSQDLLCSQLRQLREHITDDAVSKRVGEILARSQ